ncbi:uncharacterized protein LOC105845433 [Hydra vulgaris]|uniref:Uncharacterized protein LOC105845433 n=1 Tax=Hydra vulgaris TaxID=6087 RepID=A0ABM4B5D2_HYDVU
MSNSARKSAYVFDYRITFLGGEKVGKSALINQIVKKTFIEQYTPTVSNYITHIVELEGYAHVCLITDTAGVEDFPAMRKLAILKGNAFVVVYAVDNRSSFETAKKIVLQIKHLKESDEETRVVLVGNKSDLSRVVSFEEGLDYSKRLDEEHFRSAFVESCAKVIESSENIINTTLNLYLSPKNYFQNIGSLNQFTRQRSFKSINKKNGSSAKNLNVSGNNSEKEEISIPCNKPHPRFQKRSISQPNIKTTANIDTLLAKNSKLKALDNIRRGSLPQKLLSHTVYRIRSCSISNSPSSTSISSRESDEPNQDLENIILAIPELNSLKPKHKNSINKKVRNIFRYFKPDLTIS